MVWCRRRRDRSVRCINAGPVAPAPDLIRAGSAPRFLKGFDVFRRCIPPKAHPFCRIVCTRRKLFEDFCPGRTGVISHRRKPNPKATVPCLVQVVQDNLIKMVGQLLQFDNRKALTAVAQTSLNIQNVNRKSLTVDGHPFTVSDDPNAVRFIDDLAQLAERPT